MKSLGFILISLLVVGVIIFYGTIAIGFADEPAVMTFTELISAEWIDSILGTNDSCWCRREFAIEDMDFSVFYAKLYAGTAKVVVPSWIASDIMVSMIIRFENAGFSCDKSDNRELVFSNPSSRWYIYLLDSPNGEKTTLLIFKEEL